MPILPPEPCQFPEILFQEPIPQEVQGRTWWVIHTLPRQEKTLGRRLLAKKIPFYLPTIMRRNVVRGRKVNSFVPLFAGYLFLLADPDERIGALTTNRIVRTLPVKNQNKLWHDLRQVHRLIALEAPITPEDKLAAGMEVEIRNGPLAGLRGKIISSASGRRFVVAVDFIQLGASVLLDDYALIKAD